MPTTGDHGQPIFAGTDPVAIAAYLTQVSAYASLVGNRVTGTASQRAGFVGAFGFAPWEGLEFYETDTGDEFVYNGSSWDDAARSGPVATSGFFTPASGWGFSSSGFQRSVVTGADVQCYISFYRTGGTISVGATGNIVNQTVGTVSIPPLIPTTATSGSNGRLTNFTIDTGGSVTIVSVAPGADILNGDGHSFGTRYAWR